MSEHLDGHFTRDDRKLSESQRAEQDIEFWKDNALSLVVLLRAKCSDREWAAMEPKFDKYLASGAALFAEMRGALQLAQEWLLNSVPTVELDGPKPLPVIAAVLRKVSER